MIIRYRIEWEIEAEDLQGAKTVIRQLVMRSPEGMTQTMEVLEATEESLVKKEFE